MIQFKKAIDIIKKNVITSQTSEVIYSYDSHKRILNKSYISKYNIPNVNTSAMDGILVLEKNKSKFLKIIGESKAGDSKGKKLKEGECILIFTGAPIAGNNKKVIPNENFKIKGGIVKIELNPNHNFIRKIGSDLIKGKVYLKKNSIITIRSRVLAESMKLTKLKVKKKPKIFIICTGDEIVPRVNKKSILISTNNIFMKFFVELFGAEVIKVAYSKDNEEEFEKVLKSQKEFDCLITSGGISKGKYDIVKSTLVKNDLEILFDRVAIKPGKPTTFGRFSKSKYFLGLPGNPVSCFMSIINFFPIFINSFYGIDFIKTSFRSINSKKYIKENNSLMHFQRVSIKNRSFEVFKNQDSSLLNTLNLSDGILIRKPNAKSIKSGEKAEIMFFNDINNHQI